MRSLPISFCGRVVKVEYGYDEEAQRWYVADHNVHGEDLPADSPEEFDAEVADEVDFLKAIDRSLEVERGMRGDR